MLLEGRRWKDDAVNVAGRRTLEGGVAVDVAGRQTLTMSLEGRR